ncbi:breast cancer anti-estrogen resistance protein 3 homolog [Xenopus laevis]|uniref:Breast cancer anti-estrogen resistance protein 3 homolog n=1 Tax=Xenopus laevis TaxID=8355 RepID=BCAR3_XENLA|nr:breast cancer anti-estrogen resistance protein 3 homolog [Xenopus laevis]Q6INP9.1 RecName: Full=Breast cancer anti-estrogen resistance protein 3 homolog [Xenopus laevis]AAH72225.1 MGC81454 protein [Xenopus laevis]
MAAGKFASYHRNVQMNHPLVSSMDLLGSKSALGERRSDAFKNVCIHGTLPRKKKERVPIRSSDMFCHMGTLPHTKSHRLPNPLMQDIKEDYPFQERRTGIFNMREHYLDPAMEYVKFSKDRYIMDGGTPDKLKKELEEELKLNSEDLRSHAWYHGRIPRQVSESLVKRDGDFLIRDSLSSPGNLVLTCQWKNLSQHFKINKVVIRLNEAYCRIQYQLEHESFDSIPALVRFYVGNRKAVSQQSGAIIFQPINRTVPLRCIEEKYGTSPVRRLELGIMEVKSEPTKRLSLNFGQGISQEQSLVRGNLLRNKEKSGSQPACLDNMREKRRPLKAHQSESYLPLGSRQPCLSQGMDMKTSPKPHVFRTGSEPTLSPTEIRRFNHEVHPVEALRGSDSQLCPRPPPKPTKAPSIKQSQSPLVWQSSEANYCEFHPTPPEDCAWSDSHSSHNSYIEDQRTDEIETLSFSNSELSFPALDDSISQCSATDFCGNVEDDEFIRPVYETVSSFCPNDFQSVLLTAENKPLETSLLRRAKELFTNNDPRTIAKHILRMDCKVARILDVTPEVERMMGVSSGLELIILPYGHQLRLDLMERHSTMAIGIAVDILGCTGNLEERVATLHKIIQLAVEVKTLGDYFAFSAIMKALDMPQITRLEQTWTMLRHQYTQTAITYEKQLKPFSKYLHEGEALDAQEDVTVPLVMPLVTLLERQSVLFEGMDFWENNDRGCEILFNHLQTARQVAHNATVYKKNAQRILEGFKPDELMSEIFKTEFQMRLLWGSKGALLKQSERYHKFGQILTALSRKLEPPS